MNCVWIIRTAHRIFIWLLVLKIVPETAVLTNLELTSKLIFTVEKS